MDSVNGELSLEARAVDPKQLIEENESIVMADKFYEDQAPSVRLFDRLNLENLGNIKARFKATKSGRLSKEELQSILNEFCPNMFDEEEFQCFYLKLNFKQTGKADWDEFLTFLMMEFEEKGKTTTKTTELIELPIIAPVKYIKSFHRHPIIRILYYPTVDMNRTFNYQKGKYLTCSKDGIINYWSLDMLKERTSFSRMATPRIGPNPRILDLVCMPDVSIVCVCSMARDVRFYDTSARKFELRVMITDLNWPITCMDYSFSQNIEEDSKLIMGDGIGSVFILFFNSKNRGPFLQKAGVDVTSMKFDAVVKGRYKEMRILQFLNIHSDLVCQVALHMVNSFFSCSTTPEASLLLCEITQVRKPYVFNVPGLGISCFAYDEDIHLLVTGGGDGLLRLWNPFVPEKNSGTCKKHDAKICAIIIQKDHNLIYAISQDRCLKVWDFRTYRCLRTLDGLTEMGKNSPTIPLLYNPETHMLMAASVKIALIKCLRVINETYTDGFTHSKTVTKVLYNSLYKTVLTVSKDSSIIAWEPFIGKSLFRINHAHTNMVLGELKDLAITAAEFDPSRVLLITGASNGSLKVWNFNEKKCVRNMTTPDNSRVVEILWISNRILVMTWYHLIEFLYPEGTIVGKVWENIHTDDFTGCAVGSNFLVTSSFNGELIFWTLGTAQPIKGFINSGPEKNKVFELCLKKLKSKKQRDLDDPPSTSSIFTESSATSSDSDLSKNSKSSLQGNENVDNSLQNTNWGSSSTIHAITCLNTRPVHPEYGSVLVSTNSGYIQMWSPHKMGGLILSFRATKNSDVNIVTMITEPNNEYLFTGDTIGYIRIYCMHNTGIPESERVTIDHMFYYNKFPFYAMFNGDMTFENVNYPILLSCYQGHAATVTSLNFIRELEVLVSASTDNSARLWTMEGQYVGTLGNSKYWNELERNTKAKIIEPRLPPDIRRICSETTLKVLSYKNVPEQMSFIETKEFKMTGVSIKDIPKHGLPVSDPILGNYFILPKRGKRKMKFPKVDATSGQYIKIYSHMTGIEPLQDIGPIKLELQEKKDEKESRANNRKKD